MANTPSLVEFVVDQLGPEVSSRAMFGEHGIYNRGVLVGLFCDDRLFLKPTDAGAQLLGKHDMEPPYPGAKPAMVVAEESWEDRELMMCLAEVTATELALPGRDPSLRAQERGDDHERRLQGLADNLPLTPGAHRGGSPGVAGRTCG